MEFCKLNKNFSVGDYQVLDTQMSFVQNKKGITYYHVRFDKFDAFELIPDKYRDYFTVTLMRVNDQIPPHTDSGIKSTINIYIKTQSCVTQFYKFRHSDPAKEQISNQTDGFIFSENDLEKTNSFVAEPTQAWLLDVSQPHSVIPQRNFDERIAVAVSSTLAYDHVKSILQLNGNL
jgi:hypothetical protein